MKERGYYELAAKTAQSTDVKRLMTELGNREQELNRLMKEFIDQVKNNRSRREGKAFKRQLGDLGSLGSDCMAIQPALEALDKLAAKKKLASLSEFVNHDPGSWTGEKARWFDPAAGLAAVQGMLALLKGATRPVKNA